MTKKQPADNPASSEATRKEDNSGAIRLGDLYRILGSPAASVSVNAKTKEDGVNQRSYFEFNRFPQKLTRVA